MRNENLTRPPSSQVEANTPMITGMIPLIIISLAVALIAPLMIPLLAAFVSPVAMAASHCPHK